MILLLLTVLVALYLFRDPRLHDYSFQPNGNHITERKTATRKITYYVDRGHFSNTLSGWLFGFKVWEVRQSKQDKLIHQLEENVEAAYLKRMRILCKKEKKEVQKKGKTAGFWVSGTPSCDEILKKFGES